MNLAIGPVPLVISAELLARTSTMPARRPLHANRRQFFFPRPEQQCMPLSLLPLEKRGA
jgi:hypothetical protein